MSGYKIDARHMRCPLPVLRAQKILKTMRRNEKLEITGTDPASIKEFEIFQSAQKDFEIHEKIISDDSWQLILIKL